MERHDGEGGGVYKKLESAGLCCVGVESGAGSTCEAVRN